MPSDQSISTSVALFLVAALSPTVFLALLPYYATLPHCFIALLLYSFSSSSYIAVYGWSQATAASPFFQGLSWTTGCPKSRFVPGAMASPVFFFVVSQEEMMDMMDKGEIGVGPWGYIGLREMEADALARYVLVENNRMRPANNLLPAMMARIVFTNEALLQYLTTCVGAAGHFRPWLSKKIYFDGQDWKVWHCQVPIPIRTNIAEVTWTAIAGLP